MSSDVWAALGGLKKGQSLVYYTGITQPSPPAVFGFAASLVDAGVVTLVQRAVGTAFITDRGRVQRFEYIAQGLTK